MAKNRTNAASHEFIPVADGEVSTMEERDGCTESDFSTKVSVNLHNLPHLQRKESKRVRTKGAMKNKTKNPTRQVRAVKRTRDKNLLYTTG